MARFDAKKKSLLVAMVAATAVLVGLTGAPASATPATARTVLAEGLVATQPVAERPGIRPTVVLVHGAWADSSSWDGVIAALQQHAYPVEVFPTPLRSLAGDSAALRTFLLSIGGPVILVGHSYGGAVITDAATGSGNVKALVYLDAFAPDKGEKALQLASATSVLANPDPTRVFRFVPNSLPPTPSTDLYIVPTFFPAAFAGDIPARRAAVLAVTGRPVTYGALTEASTEPAWRSIVSWYEVGTRDRVIPPAAQLMMARRAHAHIVFSSTAHLPMVSRPMLVDRVIESAARATT